MHIKIVMRMNIEKDTAIHYLTQQFLILPRCSDREGPTAGAKTEPRESAFRSTQTTSSIHDNNSNNSPSTAVHLVFILSCLKARAFDQLCELFTAAYIHL